MTVPAVPFYASQALAEFGLSGLVSQLAGKGGGPGVPLLLSSFAGRSNTVAIDLSPADQAEGGTSSSKVFAGITAIPASGSPTSYSWGVSSSSGGSFSVSGGQGTATAGFTVTGVLSGGTAFANIYCDVVINGVTNRGAGTLSYTRS